jgi:hypothetical protein
VLFLSHWLCSFWVVFFPWLFSCYSFCIGCVLFMLVLLFVAHWCCCLTALVMLFIAHWCSCSSMLVLLPSYVDVLALPTSILLCLSHKCCCLSHIGVVNLVTQLVLPFPHCVVDLVTLVLLFLSHQCVSLVNLEVAPPPPRAVSWKLEHQLSKDLEVSFFKKIQFIVFNI